MNKFINVILKIIKDRINRAEMRFYDEYTIENYFRKKGYRIGKNNRIYIKSFGSEPFLVKIGNHCTITGGVAFITHDGGAWVFREKIPDLNVFGKIEIRDNSFIGINSIIMPNVIIGPNSIVGAGSVVTKDVPANTVTAGVPAKIICSIEEYKEKCLEKWSMFNLQGSRCEWERQLVRHFWGAKN